MFSLSVPLELTFCFSHDRGTKMESKRDLYKQRSRNGLATRESRARLKERESKSGREALLLAKRRIPLSALQEETKRKAAGIAFVLKSV